MLIYHFRYISTGQSCIRCMQSGQCLYELRRMLHSILQLNTLTGGGRSPTSRTRALMPAPRASTPLAMTAGNAAGRAATAPRAATLGGAKKFALRGGDRADFNPAHTCLMSFTLVDVIQHRAPLLSHSIHVALTSQPLQPGGSHEIRFFCHDHIATRLHTATL